MPQQAGSDSPNTGDAPKWKQYAPGPCDFVADSPNGKTCARLVILLGPGDFASKALKLGTTGWNTTRRPIRALEKANDSVARNRQIACFRNRDPALLGINAGNWRICSKRLIHFLACGPGHCVALSKAKRFAAFTFCGCVSFRESQSPVVQPAPALGRLR